MINVIVYLRVSTKKQDTTNYSIEKQLFCCSNHIFKNKYKINDIVKDVGSAYTNNDRNLNEIIKDKDSLNKIDKIIVSSYDRLSRNLRNGMNIINTLKKKNIIVESVNNNIDYSNSGGIKKLKNIFRSAQIKSDILSNNNSKNINNLIKYLNNKPSFCKRYIRLVKLANGDLSNLKKTTKYIGVDNNKVLLLLGIKKL